MGNKKVMKDLDEKTLDSLSIYTKVAMRDNATASSMTGGIRRAYADYTMYLGKLNQDGQPHGQGKISYASDDSSVKARSEY